MAVNEKYNVTGMSCAACSAHVEKAVSALSGVSNVTVNLLTNSMTLDRDDSVSENDICEAVEKAGYGASPASGSSPASAASEKDRFEYTQTPKMIRRLIVSICILIPLMYVSMGHMMWDWPIPKVMDTPVSIGLYEMLLTIIVMLINRKFFISGFKSLTHGGPNMDTLVALGAGASFAYSLAVVFGMGTLLYQGDTEAAIHCTHDLYFESAAMILTLITIGKTLETYSKGKTTSAIKGLMDLAPKTATVIRDGKEMIIPAEDVSVGDIFLVHPGERIPVDGKVLDGESAVDESALTGESLPVDKSFGSTVSSSTINQNGFLTCEATRVGSDTTLSQIIEMVEDSAASKAPIAKTADKVSGIFVPAVIGIALITMVIWLIAGRDFGFSLARAVSVLVISCPCALGLATPVAIMVGNGLGAKNGILFKTAVSLEETGKAKIVALDKTGTITQGQPEVTDILPVEGVVETELLSIAYALEKKSEHPLARAIHHRAGQEGLTAAQVQQFQALPGNGLTASLDGITLLGGSFQFISGQLAVSEAMKAKAEMLSGEGKTPLLFARDGKLCGIIAVADTIKEDSPQAIAQMRNMGIHVVMLTGDNQRTAKAIGARVGVDEVIAGVLPDGKESVIRALRKKGKVIMVGDGINDAPALTSADIGIAIGAGADVAIDAADVVLMKSSLSDVPAAIRLSRATLRNIHENLFWAFLYNTIGIPLAAGVFIPLLGWQLNPMFAAAAMSLSSFSVVTNALRLNFFRMHDSKRDHKIKSTIKKETKTMEKTLKIEGMMCGHCEMHTKKALEALDGVASAEVSHKTGTAVVTLNKDVSDDVLKQAVAEQGYEVTDIQ